MKRGRHLSAHIHRNSVKLLISFDISRKYFKKSSFLGVLIQSVILTCGAFEELLRNICGSQFVFVKKKITESFQSEVLYSALLQVHGRLNSELHLIAGLSLGADIELSISTEDGTVVFRAMGSILVPCCDVATCV